MNTVSARTMSFIDEWVAKDICQKYGYDEKLALRKFLESKTYQMVRDYETAVYMMSPKIVFDMWEAEQKTGDPRNSAYIKDSP